jgi:GntR family transcriptional regulator, rspAB operon transcriptional repressor
MQPTTCEEQVFQAMRTGIVNGDVPVGEFLSQRKLAAQFDTSLITARAALRRLESLGLIENVPRWGVRIPQDTPDNVRDRYFVREVLELTALRRALSDMTAERAAHLMELAAACDRIQSQEDEAIRRFADAHMALHRGLVEYADSLLLLDQYDRLMARNLMLVNARRGWGQGDCDPQHHQTLIRAMLDHSAAQATTALRAHIRRGLERELEGLKHNGDLL